MREIINSFIDNSKERIKNPFIGAFIISWIAFNWKPIFIILFSSKAIEERIEIVEISYVDLLYNLWLPLIFACIYVAILPYLMLLFDKISGKGIEGRKENLVKQNILDIRAKQRLAKEESELENIRASYRDKADLNKKIEGLTEKLENQKEYIDNLKIKLSEAEEKGIRYQEIIEQNKNEEYSTREKFELADQYVSFVKSDIFKYFQELGTDVSQRGSVPNNMDGLIIEKYKHSGIIKEVRDEENQRISYNFTKKGKYFWREFVMNLQINDNLNEEVDELPF